MQFACLYSPPDSWQQLRWPSQSYHCRQHSEPGSSDPWDWGCVRCELKIWPPSWSSSWWTILSSSSQLKEVYHVGGVHLWEVVGQVQDVLHQVAARSENTHFLKVEDQWYWIWKKFSRGWNLEVRDGAVVYDQTTLLSGGREYFLDLSLKSDDLQAFIRISNHIHL